MSPCRRQRERLREEPKPPPGNPTRLAASWPKNNSPVGKRRTVELVIDYGDGVQKHFDEIAWKESMTVLDVLQAGSRHSHGITFTSHGTGESLLISKLDDLANQGRTTSDKNWIFRVNGQLGDEDSRSPR